MQVQQKQQRCFAELNREHEKHNSYNQNTSENIKNRIGKQHNLIPDLILAVITPDRRVAPLYLTPCSSLSVATIRL